MKVKKMRNGNVIFITLDEIDAVKILGRSPDLGKFRIGSNRWHVDVVGTKEFRESATYYLSEVARMMGLK